MSHPPPYRAEVVGSMLRPEELKEAQHRLQQGEISAGEFKAIEDRAADEAIAIQERSGVDVITDGEMRRWSFIAAVSETVEGVEFRADAEENAPRMHWHGGQELGEFEFPVPLAVTGRLRRVRSLSTEEYTYARARTDKPIKVTLTSPLMLSSFWWPGISDKVYSDAFEAFCDAADIIRQEIRELAGLGCEYVQIDAPELATHVLNEDQRAYWEANGIAPDRLLDEGVELLNSLADVPGIYFTLHICRGNFAGRWLGDGGYEAVSSKVLERATSYDAFSLEYDSPRAGSFEPLRGVPEDKK